MKRQTREQLLFEENKKLRQTEQATQLETAKKYTIPLRNDWNDRPYFAAYNNTVTDNFHKERDSIENQKGEADYLLNSFVRNSFESSLES